MKNKIFLAALAILFIVTNGCTDLDSESYSELTEQNAYTNETTLLNGLSGVYGTLGFYTDAYFKMVIPATDEGICPTRGADWNSSDLRNLHSHLWTPENGEINGAYNSISGAISKCNAFIDAVENGGFSSEAVDVMIGETRFLRAFYYYLLCDNFGIAPIITTQLKEAPMQSTRKQLFDFILSELNEIETILPEINEYGRVDRNAIWFLKAKLFLNAEVYVDSEMLGEALVECNKIIASNTYHLYNEGNSDSSREFLDIFANDNDQADKRVENIFTIRFNSQTDDWGKAFFLQQNTLHYNLQEKYGLAESPWNGFATIRDAVERYDAVEGNNNIWTSEDQRFKCILTGQQYDNAGVALTERDESIPLNFTIDFRSLENATESNGARVLKWVPGGVLISHFINNDFTIFRFADVILMKAEILARQNGGTITSEALELINVIRRRSNATELTSATMDDLLDERGREFLWEFWRRNDLIRFNKFTTVAWDLKTNIGETYRNLYSIPTSQISNNPNLKQNSGY